jgi:hypothetical protein
MGAGALGTRSTGLVFRRRTLAIVNVGIGHLVISALNEAINPKRPDAAIFTFISRCVTIA